MQYVIENAKWNYADNRVSFMADVVIYDDSATPIELWRSPVAAKRHLDTTGWYASIKTELLAKAVDIRDQYIAKMSQVLTDTSQTSVEDIVADIVSHIEGGL